MKKIAIFFFTLFAFTTVVTKAQNIQIHYDFGHVLYDEDKNVRAPITTTLELFKPDKWGSTFFFVDMDYTSKGIQASYWEIARELKFWKCPLSLHLEYNGGLSNSGSYGHNFLLGTTYAKNGKNFSYGYSLTPAYKYITINKDLNLGSPHSFQLTGTWYLHFGKNNLFTFNGFADLWTDASFAKTPLTFISEPQLWINLNKVPGIDPNFNLSIGTEQEITYNFPYENKKFKIIPTLAVKWTF